MTLEERASRLAYDWYSPDTSPSGCYEQLRRDILEALQAVVAAEQEACALLIECCSKDLAFKHIAHAIRARNQP